MHDMKMISSKVLECLVGMIVFAGCSVKENRDMCPCWLVLDFSEVDTTVIKYADLVMTADDGFVFTENLVPEEFSRDVAMSVPRTELNLEVWNGTEDMLTENGLRIPYGDDCPPVYFHTSIVDTRCESVRETVMMRKNHCRMTVNLNFTGGDTREVDILGNVDGFLSDGTPSRGEFSYRLHGRDDGEYCVVLPRQLDNSMSMEINDDTGVVKRFALGEYVAESGYDWSAPDLEDVTIDIDIAFTGVTLVIQGWEKTYSFDVVI